MPDARKPVALAELLQRDRTFGHNAAGDPITRRQLCACGTRFVQRQLSEAFLKIVEKRGGQAMAMMTREIPDFFVPVHCPACERKDLGLHARRADIIREAQATMEAAD